MPCNSLFQFTRILRSKVSYTSSMHLYSCMYYKSLTGTYNIKSNHCVLSKPLSTLLDYPVRDVLKKAGRKSQRLQNDGPTLKDFLIKSQINNESLLGDHTSESIPYASTSEDFGANRTVYFDVYGCQMNVNDTEIIWSILQKNGFKKTDCLEKADIALLVTCAIREGAESKIWHRINELNAVRNKRGKEKTKMKIGILGCMAERLKHTLLEKEKCVDLVGGPDSYKDLPRLLALTDNNQKAINVLLSLDETYADVLPVRLNQNSVTAFVSIMRGCDNMCTYCIVPFTRGRERSRPVSSIISEVKHLSEQGIKEITLLGQNVNSYRDLSEASDGNTYTLAKGFKTVYKPKTGGLRFADLLERVADVDPEIRIRFTSPHPKDFPDHVLEVIKEKPNVCKNLHIPAQSGNSNVLERMRRGYTRESYIELIHHIRDVLPEVTLSSDFIAGFCSETDEEFQDTISLMELIRYNVAYLFGYSMREKTTAHRRYKDDILEEIKKDRIMQMNEVFRRHATSLNKAQIGQKQLVLVEGLSKKSDQDLVGRNDGNVKVIFPKVKVPVYGSTEDTKAISAGDYVVVQINEANSQVLKGAPLCCTSLETYFKEIKNPL